METVTSSDLVRHFGVWRDRALATPVYIHHHGRAKLVLASVDFMEHLVTSRGGPHLSQPSLDALLKLIDCIVIVVDDRLRVVGASRPARRHFLNADPQDDQLDSLLTDPLGAILMRAVRMVADSGVAETLQLRTGPRADRRIDVTVQPFGAGVCIIGHDRTTAEACAAAEARASSIEQTLTLLGGIASLRINLRGYIVDASPTFEAMTGLPAGGYRSVRFPTLFDLPTRVGVSEAFERAVDTLQPQSADARLVSKDGGTFAVRIAFSGEMLRASEDIVLATIAAPKGGSEQP